jgi:predicted phosphodiesterase
MMSRLSIFALLFLLFGCDKFQYTPYRVDVDPEVASLNKRNLEQLTAVLPGEDSSLTFAVIGDSHGAYDELSAAIKHINRTEEIQFVIHVGDMTELGLLKEYQWLHEIVNDLRVPYLTVIGNHDCLTNGVVIYEQMFGPLDYAFDIGGFKFVFLNTNSWEFSGGVPNLKWLASQLDSLDGYQAIFVVSHVPPFGDQFSEADGQVFTGLLAASDVHMSIHGHMHSYLYADVYGDGVKYLVTDDIMDRCYSVVRVVGDSTAVDVVYY